MRSLSDRIVQQRRLVETMRGRLSFEMLVLERLESRVAVHRQAEPPQRTLTDVLDGARRRAGVALHTELGQKAAPFSTPEERD